MANRDQLERLRRFNAQIKRGDKEATDELESVQLEVLESPASVEQGLDNESIVLRTLRPVLAVKGGTTELVFTEKSDSETWQARLETAKPLIANAIAATGRITAKGSPTEYIGTGWLVRDDLLVTNRHVALEFASRGAGGFEFKTLGGDTMTGSIDFLQEFDRPDSAVFEMKRPVYISDDSGPDLAFFELSYRNGNAKPIALAAKPHPTAYAATIGYPAMDTRIRDFDLMTRVYRGLYNKKRLAPGAVTVVRDNSIEHDCTTLGGNSGSAVIDLETGEALGLHFSGTFLTANYAVRSDIVAKFLDGLGKPKSAPRVEAAVSATPRRSLPTQRAGEVSVTIPLTITVSLGGAAAIAASTLETVGGNHFYDVWCPECGLVASHVGIDEADEAAMRHNALGQPPHYAEPVKSA